MRMLPDLLESMDAIIELTSLGATRYGGNWSVYRERNVNLSPDALHAAKKNIRNFVP